MQSTNPDIHELVAAQGAVEADRAYGQRCMDTNLGLMHNGRPWFPCPVLQARLDAIRSKLGLL